jgi:S1-C subfamily serine protease
MRIAASSVFCTIFGLTAALAQIGSLPSDASVKMEMKGDAIAGSSASENSLSFGLDEFSSDIPTNQISKFANSTTPLDGTGAVRNAKGRQLYLTVSPAVVLVATKEGFGSGSLLDTAGNILTNWHVVKGYEYVAVIFKPTVEGKEPTRDDIKRGRVVKYDEIADLALVKVSEVPTGRTPVRLGDSSEIAVGMDVHAIGHPTGEAWTYTTGVISQYRQGYEWKAEGDPIKHRADIIQTQTPINPGNSGGPLLSDSSSLIGVNSFKAGGEGLNFAVSVDEVRKFLARSGDRIAQTPSTKKSDRECKPKQLSKFRNEKKMQR